MAAQGGARPDPEDVAGLGIGQAEPQPAMRPGAEAPPPGTGAVRPVEMSFQEGLDRVRAVLQKAGLDLEQGIITSRDPRVQALREELRIPAAAEGFEMWQLPITLRHALLFLSVARPGAAMPEHGHAGRTVFRLVISGSIVYEDTELTAGDWMYVPKGHRYAFRAGPSGATLLYPHGE